MAPRWSDTGVWLSSIHEDFRPQGHQNQGGPQHRTNTFHQRSADQVDHGNRRMLGEIELPRPLRRERELLRIGRYPRHFRSSTRLDACGYEGASRLKFEPNWAVFP